MKIEVKQEAKLLDFVLNHFPQVSVTKAKKMILYNCFSMAGASLKSFEYVLHKGDTIEYQKYSGGEHIAREKRNISVLYEDREIILIYKLSNQSVMEYKDKKNDTLFSMTKSYLKKKYHKNDLYLIFFFFIDESGICLFAKNRMVKNWLDTQKDSFKFTISAIVENPLKHKNDKIHFDVTNNNGIYSLAKKEEKNIESVILQYSTIEDLSVGEENYFYINIVQTGDKPYLNRFLLNKIGNPVYGDNAFHSQKQGNKLLRYCVYCMEFLRPSTNKKLKIETTLPKNFTLLTIPAKKIDKK